MRLQKTVLPLVLAALPLSRIAAAQETTPPAKEPPRVAEEPAPSAHVPSPEAAVGTEKPSAEPASPPAMGAASNHVACVVGEHPREYPDSARTATAMVCDALRERGVDVGAPVPDPGSASAAYVVNLDQLGSTFFLRVNYEEPIGTVRRTRRISLSDLAEAEVAAPRVAQALLQNKKTEETLSYDNVVGSEARLYRKKQGDFVIGGGIAGISMPAQGAYMGPAFQLFGFYETDDWGIGLQFHFGDAALDTRESGSFVALSVGGRYFLTHDDITPVLGAGLALSRIHEHRNDFTYASLDGSGTSAYVEAGVEMFRFHKTHLVATLRADLPFYVLNRKADYGYDYYYPSTPTTPPAVSGPEKRYEVPLTVNVGIGF